MNIKNNEIFVPGKMVLFGEFADLLSQYSRRDMYSIVLLDDNYGIYARYEILDDPDLVYIKEERRESTEMTYPLYEPDLKDLTDLRDHFPTIRKTLLYMIKNYRDEIYSSGKGVKITNYKNTLVMGAGFGTSGAIITLIIGVLNKVFNLNMSDKEISEAVYQIENSEQRCGRMSSINVYPSGLYLTTFNNTKMKVDRITPGKNYYFLLYGSSHYSSSSIVFQEVLNKLDSYEKDIDILDREDDPFGLKLFAMTNNESTLHARRLIENANIDGLASIMKITQDIANYTLTDCCGLTSIRDSSINDIFYYSALRGSSSIGNPIYISAVKGINEHGDNVAIILTPTEETRNALIKQFLNNLSYPIDITSPYENEYDSQIAPLIDSYMVNKEIDDAYIRDNPSPNNPYLTPSSEISYTEKEYAEMNNIEYIYK